MSALTIQEGTTRDIPPIDLVVFAMNASRPTTLRLQRGDTVRKLVFRERALVAVTSSELDDSLADLMVEQGLIDDDQADIIEQEASRTGAPHAHIATALALCPTDDLLELHSLWATLMLVQSLDWRDADYKLQSADGTALYAASAPNVNLARALMKGVWDSLRPLEAHQLLTPLLDLRPRAAAPLPFSTRAFGFDDRQVIFWDSIDGRRTIREIQSFSPLSPQDTTRMLILLHRTRMITFDEPVDDSPLDRLDMASFGAEDSPAGDDASEPFGAPLASIDPADSGEIDLSQIRFRKGRRTTRKTVHTRSDRITEEVVGAGSLPPGQAQRRRAKPAPPLKPSTAQRAPWESAGADQPATPQRRQRRRPAQAAAQDAREMSWSELLSAPASIDSLKALMSKDLGRSGKKKR